MRECREGGLGKGTDGLTVASPVHGTRQGHKYVLNEIHIANKHVVMHIIKFPPSYLLCAENLALATQATVTHLGNLPQFTGKEILLLLQLHLTSE